MFKYVFIDALSRFHIEAEDVHDVIFLNFMHHLNTAHIYHRDLSYTIYNVFDHAMC